jgi:hypothetical protein
VKDDERVNAAVPATRTVLLLISLLQIGCGSLCSNRVLFDVVSPTGHQHAVVFERDCGATTGFSWQVAILGANELVGNNVGNAFIADSNHGAVNSVPVRVKWLSPGQVVIGYPLGARVLRRSNWSDSHFEGCQSSTRLSEGAVKDDESGL